jgi:multidrug efflux pump subunit AcrA (membrane-fusion protein)
MKPKPLIIGVVMILCAGLAIFALTKWHREFSGGDDDEGGGAKEEAEAVVTVQTNALQRMTLHQYAEGFGTVEPAPATADHPAAGGPISSPTAGVVAKVNVVLGQEVKEGDVLVELNSGTASFNYTKAEVERQKKLFADQNTSRKNLQDAEAQLAALQVVAPISGTVTRLAAKPGAAIDANAVVAEVIDLNRLTVSAAFPVSDAAQLKTGEEIQISQSITSSVSFVSPAVEAADSTVLTRALLPPDSGLRPGQFVPVRVITDTHTNSLAAPAAGVVTDEDGKSFVVLANGTEAAQIPVKTGLRENGWVEIEGAGLKEGATVVTVGAYGFPEKAKIRIAGVESDEDSTDKAAAKTNAATAKSAPEK